MGLVVVQVMVAVFEQNRIWNIVHRHKVMNVECRTANATNTESPPVYLTSFVTLLSLQSHESQNL